MDLLSWVLYMHCYHVKVRRQGSTISKVAAVVFKSLSPVIGLLQAGESLKYKNYFNPLDYVLILLVCLGLYHQLQVSPAFAGSPLENVQLGLLCKGSSLYYMACLAPSLLPRTFMPSLQDHLWAHNISALLAINLATNLTVV
jgi:hypothetical protein